MVFGGLVLVNSLAKGFQGEIGFLEKHKYKHNIFPLCWQLFKKTTH